MWGREFPFSAAMERGPSVTIGELYKLVKRRRRRRRRRRKQTSLRGNLSRPVELCVVRDLNLDVRLLIMQKRRQLEELEEEEMIVVRYKVLISF